MPRSGTDPTAGVEVYVHAAGTSVWEGQTRFVRRVEELAERDVVRGVSVNVWPRRVCAAGGLAGTTFHSDALTAIDRFSDWADGVGVALPFDRHHVVSEFADVDHEVVDTPAICAAVVDDGSLVGVYPHQHASRSCTVEDLLARVAHEGVAGVRCQPEARSSLASHSVTSTDGA